MTYLQLSAAVIYIIFHSVQYYLTMTLTLKSLINLFIK